MPPPLLEAVSRVLERDSRLGGSASATIDYLMDLLYYGEFDIFEQVSSTDQADFVNLVGVKGSSAAGPPLWLVSCVATGEDPEPSAWKRSGGSPFASRIDREAGVLRGLGAASGKVDLVLKLMAASRFFADELTRPVYVVALFGEEARSTGIGAVLADHRLPGAAVVGAPTNLEIWTDHPGLVVLRVELSRTVRHRRMPPTRGMFEVRIPGRSAHAQAPASGDDAIASAFRVLEVLREPGDIRVLSFDAGEGANRVPGRARIRVATSYEALPPLPAGVEAEPLPDGASVPFPIDPLLRAWLRARDAGIAAVGDGFAPGRNLPAARPHVGVHTGRLGSDRDQVSGTVAFWTGPGVGVQGVQEQVERFADAASRALAGEEEMELALHVQQERPAFSGRESATALSRSAARVLRSLEVPAAISGGVATSEAGLLTLHGVPTIAFGPGRGPWDQYVDDECVPIVHLEKTFAFYERLIQDLCMGGGAPPSA